MALDPEHAPCRRADDAVDGQAVARLKALDCGLRFGAEVAVGAEVQRALQSRLTGLVLPVVDGRPNSPYEDAVSGKTYQFDENEDGWKSITATFVDGACDIEIDRVDRDL